MQTVPDADDLEWAAAENAQEEWECVACGKTFRSEAAWDSHERSRKHLKAVEELKRQMREESEELGLGEDDGSIDKGDGDAGSDEVAEEPPETPAFSEADAATGGSDDEQGATDSEDNADVPGREVKKESNSPQSQSPALEDDKDDRFSSKPKRKKGKQPRTASPEVTTKSQRRARTLEEPSRELASDASAAKTHLEDTENGLVEEGEPGTAAPQRPPELSKREKRRAREAAKAARAEAEGMAAVKEVSTRNPPSAYETRGTGELMLGGDVQHCNVCKAEFDSRTKLFAHIKVTGHAAATPLDESRASGTKKGRKGKR